jgi:hypothetical protein
MFFSFKTVGKLQVIHQPLSRPKQIRAGEYAVGTEIGLERVKPEFSRQTFETLLNSRIHENLSGSRFVSCERTEGET